MKKDVYFKAQELEQKKEKLLIELRIWKRELDSLEKIGFVYAGAMTKSGGRKEANSLDSSIDEGLFNSFRVSAMNDLKLKIASIDDEFSKL